MTSRLLSLFWLRIKIILSNKILFVQMVLPLVFVYLYKYVYGLNGELSYETKKTLLLLCLPFALFLAVGNPISSVLSEEKEKGSLRTLFNCGVRNEEYILSTIVIPIILSVSYILIVPIILEFNVSTNMLTYIFVAFLTSLVIISVYLLIGLFSKSQVMAQVISLPITLLMTFLPVLANVNNTIDKINNFSFMGLITKLFNNWDSFWSTISSIQFVSILFWLVIFVSLDMLMVRKSRKLS